MKIKTTKYIISVFEPSYIAELGFWRRIPNAFLSQWRGQGFKMGGGGSQNIFLKHSTINDDK